MHYRERPRWRAAGAVGWTIVLAVLPGCGRPGASAAGQRSGAAAVKAVAVTQTELQRTTTQPATVRALFQTAIRARVSGYVDQLHVDIGDPVEAGQALLALDVPELDKRVAVLEARIRRLLADQSRAEAQIALAEAAQRSAEAKLAQASAELARSQATLTAAAAELRRTEDLVQRQSLQSRVLDEVRKRHDSEQAGVEVATSAIQSAQAETAVAEAQVQAARADLESAEAETEVSRSELDELRVMVDFATLRAPFDSVITERRVEPGDLVRKADEPSQGQPLLVVSQIDKVRVQIPVPEADAAYLRRGDEVTLEFPFFSDEPPIRGQVTRDSGSLDPKSRTLLVEAEMDNPERKLLPGMFGQATIALGATVAANTLPARAVRFDSHGRPYVYVIGDDETVSVIDVTTGLDDGGQLEITSGLNAGQRVIDSHLKRFRDGQQVVVLD